MEDPLLQISFHDPRWLAAFPLTHASILDYFSLSTGAQGFYDRSANNETLRGQNITDPREQQEHLRQFTGLEYVVTEAKEQEGFYVICKQMRRAPDDVAPLAYYYCLHGVIYMTPPVSAVLTARVRNAIHLLTSSFEEVRRRVRFNVTTGYSYSLGETDSPAPAAPAEAAPTIAGLDENVVKRAAHFLSAKFLPPGGAPAAQLMPAPSPASELLASSKPALASQFTPPSAAASAPSPTAPVVAASTALAPSPVPPPANPAPATLTSPLVAAPASAAPPTAAPPMSASAALAAQQAAAAALLAAQQASAAEGSKRGGKRKQAVEGEDDGKKKRRGKKADK